MQIPFSKTSRSIKHTWKSLIVVEHLPSPTFVEKKSDWIPPKICSENRYFLFFGWVDLFCLVSGKICAPEYSFRPNIGIFSLESCELGQRSLSSATEKEHVGSRRGDLQRDSCAVPVVDKGWDHRLLLLLKRLYTPFFLHLWQPDWSSGVLTQAREAFRATAYYRSSDKC